MVKSTRKCVGVPARSAPAASPAAAPAPRSFLVVDDDEITRRIVGRLLRAQGAGRVIAAADGRAARQAVRERGPFTAVFCDLAMPDLDGLELLREAAAMHAGTAVVVLNSLESKVLRSVGELARAWRLRLLGALHRPFTGGGVEALLAKLDTAEPAAEILRPAAAPISAVDLRTALEGGLVEVFVQPKIDARDRRLVGVEALARWNHGGTPIDAERFVALAEASGLADELTRCVLHKALKACAAWREAGLDTRIAVNVPAMSLNRREFPDELVRAAARFGVEPRQITLEVTESGLMQDPALSLDVLTRLRLRGVSLAIDDFGTGYSTLQQLRRFPFSEIKIDRSFVMTMLEDPESLGIVETSVRLARDLGLVSVAEGVESEAQLVRLAGLACDQVQGFFIARPFPAGELVGWARRMGFTG